MAKDAKTHLTYAIFNIDQAIGHLQIVENILADAYMSGSLYKKVRAEEEKLIRIIQKLENKSIRGQL